MGGAKNGLVRQYGHGKIVFGLVLGCLVAMVMVTGCRRGGNAGDSKPRFAFVVNVPTDRFWDIAYAGCLKAASEEDVIVEFHAPNEATAQQQKQIVEALMARGMDGMAISPLNPESLAPLIDQASEMFPVVCQDSDLCADPNNCQSKRFCYIGTDNVQLGRHIGELLKKALPDGGKVAIFVGKLDVQNAIERQRGVLESLEGSNCEVIGTFLDGGIPSEAKRVATDVLAKNPDLAGCVGLWGYNAPQVVNALSDSPDRNVVVVGSDESVETMAAVAGRTQYAAVAQQPYEFGYKSIKILSQLARGESVELPENKQVFVPTYNIVPDNVEQVDKEIRQKLELVGQLRKDYGK